ncbi:MAG: hypothetical protein KC503_21840 [Myxococcales bacterium]|nr:hypothetical protein [Myxococcales bacterium]
MRESYARIDDFDRFADAFYASLFDRDPRFADLFKRSHMKEQQKMFARALTLLVDHIDQKEFLPPYLRGLGTMHSAFGVDASYFNTFADCLIDALETTVGNAFSKDHRSAWRHALAYFFRFMRQGTATQFDETLDA